MAGKVMRLRKLVGQKPSNDNNHHQLHVITVFTALVNSLDQTAQTKYPSIQVILTLTVFQFVSQIWGIITIQELIEYLLISP